MKIKRFSKAEKRTLGLWMLALSKASDDYKAASSEPYPEGSEFACGWWNNIYDETNGRAWQWALDLKYKGRVS